MTYVTICLFFSLFIPNQYPFGADKLHKDCMAEALTVQVCYTISKAPLRAAMFYGSSTNIANPSKKIST